MFHLCSKPGSELPARRAPHSQTPRSTGLVPPSANRCGPSTSPCKATHMKKPGTANLSDSGQIGAEHKIRTGDPSPWQGDQTRSPTVPEGHQPSPTERNPSGSAAPERPGHHQRSPRVHDVLVPQVFQEGARPLDVASSRSPPRLDEG